MSTPYVALGDSFSAGIGSDTPGTQVRREGGFPVAVARDLGLDLAYQAALGATVADVLAWQAPALSAQTRLVTITVGGNDAGFTPVLIACAQPAWMSDGLAVLRDRLALAREELPGRLSSLYAALRDRAPAARIVAAGYPHLFAGVDCHPLTFFSAEEMGAIDAATDELLAMAAAAARDGGAEWVDVRGAFAGHEVCTPDAWLHDLSWPVANSFHPTTAGHAAYVPLVEVVARPAADRAAGPRGREGIAAGPGPTGNRPRVVEGPRRTGSAPRFRLPDLLSPESLDGAGRHGLDAREVAHHAGRLPRGQRAAAVDPATLDAGALAALREMDAHVRSRG